MPNLAAANEPLVVDVGELRSTAQFQRSIASQLSEIRKAYLQSPQKPLCWDMRNVQLDGSHSTAALTAFTCFAFHLSRSFQEIPTCLVAWDTRLQAFWQSIGFLRLVKSLGLLRFEEGKVGGFERLPPASSRIDYFERPPSTPSYEDEDWGCFKDKHRLGIVLQLQLRLKDALQYWESSGRNSRKSIDELTEVLAELVLNSWTWGKSGAFVGVQHTGKRLTAAVADSGVGFKKSIELRSRGNVESSRALCKVEDDIDAILLSSVLNDDRYAVRGAINFTIRTGGWASISSMYGEVSFQRPLWDELKLNAPAHVVRKDIAVNQLRAKCRVLVGREALSEEERLLGHGRLWQELLVGSRVVFELRASEG